MIHRGLFWYGFLDALQFTPMRYWSDIWINFAKLAIALVILLGCSSHLLSVPLSVYSLDLQVSLIDGVIKVIDKFCFDLIFCC